MSVKLADLLDLEAFLTWIQIAGFWDFGFGVLGCEFRVEDFRFWGLGCTVEGS